MKKLLLITLSILFLSGCQQTPPPISERGSNPKPVIEIENGIYTGVIKPLELNIYQQGTHKLITEYDNEIFIQSQVINLNKYLEKEVEIKGEKASVVGNEKPAINVLDIKLKDGEIDSTKEYKSDKFGISFNYIETWDLVENDKEIILDKNNYSLIKIESNDSIMKLAEFVKKHEESEGASITVSGKNAIRFIKENAVIIYIANISKEKIYKITFNSENKELEDEKNSFYSLLNTFTLLISMEKEGDECGGPRKLQCKEGYRCELSSGGKYAKGICVEF